MAGTVYLREHDDSLRTLEHVENIGVATPFLIITFSDGTTVLEEASRFESVQFTPYPQDSSEPAQGQSEDDSGA